MAVKGKQKEQKEFVKELFVGFTQVKVVAINPDRDEVNALVGRESSAEDKPLVYLGSDQEGNDRLRLAFWLEDLMTGKLYVHSFNLTNKERKNKDGDKVQLVNSTCTTTWAPYIKKVNKKGEIELNEDGKPVMTDKVDDSLIQDWFVSFTDKEKQVLGPKKWRKALAGEEELVTLMRSWLGRLEWFDPETEAFVDTKKLFKEDYKELRNLISLDENGEFLEEGFDTPFVILLGVRTDEEDATKKYQQVWQKAFLPSGFMKYINNGLKFPTPKSLKMWTKFKEDVEGDYGFDGYTELRPIIEYDATKDITGSTKTKKEAPVPTDSGY